MVIFWIACRIFSGDRCCSSNIPATGSMFAGVSTRLRKSPTVAANSQWGFWTWCIFLYSSRREIRACLGSRTNFRHPDLNSIHCSGIVVCTSEMIRILLPVLRPMRYTRICRASSSHLRLHQPVSWISWLMNCEISGAYTAWLNKMSLIWPREMQCWRSICLRVACVILPNSTRDISFIWVVCSMTFPFVWKELRNWQ